MEKADLSKECQNPKRKLEITMHHDFSEIIELKIRKEMSYILCSLMLLWLLNYLQKNAWLPTYFFLDSNRSC